MQRWERQVGRPLPRPVVFSGNLSQPDLGLSAGEVLWVKKHCDEVIHNAAILKFQAESPEHEPFITNLRGTENVLAFCNRTGIRHLHYVSTAYVCGHQDEVVNEEQFETGQTFRNDYERSKYEAEKCVRAATGFESKTIFRPAVIIGDSETGYTSTYHGLFLYLRLMDLLLPHQERDANGVIQTPIRLSMNGDEPRNLVTVDWVSAVIAHVVCTPEAHGQTFHLSPDRCSTAKELIDYCYKFFNSEGVEFAGAGAERTPDNDFSEAFLDNVRVYENYETSDPVFDKSNVIQWAGHLECPPLSEQMVRQFFEFARSQRWGKLAPPLPEVEYWSEEHLNEIGELAESVMSKLPLPPAQPVTLGLDIQGPGGGQWTLTGLLSEGLRILPGLPSGTSPMLTVHSAQVGQLLGGFAGEVTDTDSLGRFQRQIELMLSPQG